jgi:hypothetical protein
LFDTLSIILPIAGRPPILTFSSSETRFWETLKGGDAVDISINMFIPIFKSFDFNF